MTLSLLFVLTIATTILFANSKPGSGTFRVQSRNEWIRYGLEASSHNAPGMTNLADLDSFILRTMELQHMPGVAAAVVSDGEIVWTGTYGYANIEENIPVTDSTLFWIASISKTFTGAALLQLWEAGDIELDDDINDYLPFEVHNPHYPDSTITFRNLLTHTSSLRDNWNVMGALYVEGDSPVQLGDWLADYFVPGGRRYYPSLNFCDCPPSTVREYCNHNFALIGYIVETITGVPFEQYCQDSLFIPLGMTETSWFLEGLDLQKVAMTYDYVDGTYVPFGYIGYALYPVASIRTSNVQLARHLIAMLQKGEIDGVRVLESSTVDSMTTAQVPHISTDQGLAWFRGNQRGKTVWWHTGFDPGVATYAGFCPEGNFGVLVLANTWNTLGVTIITDRIYLYTDDPDEDGSISFTDNCPEISNPDQEDGDTDGIGDVCDNCPDETNSDQADRDGDGIGDVCDACVDTDGDGYGNPGYPAMTCATDNCPEVFNPDQEDFEKGNIDCKDGIDVLDALAVVNHILGTAPLTGAPFDRSDCNGDNGVDILDALGIINVILGIGACQSTAPE